MITAKLDDFMIAVESEGGRPHYSLSVTMQRSLDYYNNIEQYDDSEFELGKMGVLGL